MMGQTAIALVILLVATLWLANRARGFFLDVDRGATCGAACHGCRTRADSGVASPPVFEIEVRPEFDKSTFVEESQR